MRILAIFNGSGASGLLVLQVLDEMSSNRSVNKDSVIRATCPLVKKIKQASSLKLIKFISISRLLQDSTRSVQGPKYSSNCLGVSSTPSSSVKQPVSVPER